jgi:hypothetical protein
LIRLLLLFPCCSRTLVLSIIVCSQSKLDLLAIAAQQPPLLYGRFSNCWSLFLFRRLLVVLAFTPVRLLAIALSPVLGQFRVRCRLGVGCFLQRELLGFLLYTV